MSLADDLARLPALRRLQAFDCIARAGGFNAAAAVLGLTQPAITNALLALESDVGARLFDRGGRGASLTIAGQALQRRTARLFSQIEAAFHAVAGAAQSDMSKRFARTLTGTQARALIVVWDAGSFRAAAQALKCSLPALHRPARQLEAGLKVSLFRKTPQGLELTRTGVELARRLSVAMREIVSGLEELSALAGRPKSRLRIGSLALAPKRLLAMASHALLTRHPESHLEIREGSYEELAQLLRGGALDVIFGALRDPPLHDDLDTEGFFDDPYAIACRRNHPLARRRQVTRRHLAGFDWVLPSAGLPRRAVLERTMRDWDLRAPGRIETTSLSAIIALLAESDCLSLLSDFFMVGGGSELLVTLDVRVPQPRRVIGLTRRTDWLATEFQDDFVAALRAVCTDQKNSPPRARS